MRQFKKYIIHVQQKLYFHSQAIYSQFAMTIRGNKGQNGKIDYYLESVAEVNLMKYAAVLEKMIANV